MEMTKVKKVNMLPNPGFELKVLSKEKERKGAVDWEKFPAPFISTRTAVKVTPLLRTKNRRLLLTSFKVLQQPPKGFETGSIHQSQVVAVYHFVSGIVPQDLVEFFRVLACDLAALGSGKIHQSPGDDNAVGRGDLHGVAPFEIPDHIGHP